ncbi:MAG TPA: carbohydrate ABC transporter permease [Rugosimonospora sp.]|jgi:ABC-type glycerol-3-phosphate transport system permease component
MARKHRLPSPGRVTAVLGIYVLMTLVAVSILFPVVWMLYSSIKSNQDILSNVFSLPTSIKTANYHNLFAGGQMPIWLLNSAVITVVSVAGIAILSALAAYGFATFSFRGKEKLFVFCLIGLMIPPQALIVSGFKWMSLFALIGSRWALILTYLGWISFGVLVLRNFFQAVPREIIEAARIDGAGHWRIFSRIMVPLARPSIGTVVVLNFMWVWNDFIYPLVYVNSADRYTIPLGILQYQSRLGVQWGTQMAALSVAAGVPLLVYLIFQRQFIRGILAGSLKG